MESDDRSRHAKVARRCPAEAKRTAYHRHHHRPVDIYHDVGAFAVWCCSCVAFFGLVRPARALWTPLMCWSTARLRELLRCCWGLRSSSSGVRSFSNMPLRLARRRVAQTRRVRRRATCLSRRRRATEIPHRILIICQASIARNPRRRGDSRRDHARNLGRGYCGAVGRGKQPGETGDASSRRSAIVEVLGVHFPEPRRHQRESGQADASCELAEVRKAATSPRSATSAGNMSVVPAASARW